MNIPVSDEQLQAIAKMRDLGQDYGSAAKEYIDTLLQALNEREHSYNTTLHDRLESLISWKAKATELEKQASHRDSTIDELRQQVADLRKPSKGRRCAATLSTDPPMDCDAPFCGCDPAWSACIEMLQESGWLTSVEADKLNRELAELRKPVAVERNDAAERIRCRIAAGHDIHHGYQVAPLLSAYDTLAQDNARYANAHDVHMAEIRGMRERIGQLGREAEQHAGYAEHRQAELATSKERERQLREALLDTVGAIKQSISTGISLNNRDFDCIGQRALAALAQPQQTIDSEPVPVPDLYYLQYSGTVVGNSALWWREGGHGYTCDLGDAGVFTKERAFAQHRSRDLDVPRLKSEMDSMAKRHVDVQHLPRPAKKDEPAIVAVDHEGKASPRCGLTFIDKPQCEDHPNCYCGGFVDPEESGNG
jgi:polyhydroxyalkanoate synthesis regulator phasin